MTEPHSSRTLLGRSGHLHDLTLEWIVFDDLEADEHARVQAHLESCPTCAARLEAAREQERELDELVPFTSLAHDAPEPPERPANRPWAWRLLASGGAAVLAAAAGVLLWVGMPGGDPTAPDMRNKGAALTLEAFATDEADAWPLVDGDEVDPDWRVGFRVVSAEAGSLWIVGVDEALEVYPVHPPDTDGPVWYSADTEQPPALDAAVRFDETPGMERIVAVLCERELAFDRVSEDLLTAAEVTPGHDLLPALRPECLQAEIRLYKPEAP